jgi:small subunit ribosomal protein S8
VFPLNKNNKKKRKVVNDTISDLLTRIRNAILANHQVVQIPKSKLIVQILKVLVAEQFIEAFKEISLNKKPVLLISLKPSKRKEQLPITNLKRVSKPSVRVYKKAKDLPKVLGGFGVALVSTSQGIMTDRQARQNKLGGEILFYIW